MTKYTVTWLDQKSPLTVEAADYRISRGSYERESVTFFDGAGNVVRSISDVHRLKIRQAGGILQKLIGK